MNIQGRGYVPEDASQRIEATQVDRAQDNQLDRSQDLQGARKAELANQETMAPSGLARAFQAKKKKVEKNRVNPVLSGTGQTGKVAKLTKLKQSAKKFSDGNEELGGEEKLMDLADYLSPEDSAEDILKKLQQYYKDDAALQDEAIEFLLEYAGEQVSDQAGTSPLKDKLKEAREKLLERYGKKEVTAGRNIGAVSRDAEYGGVQTAKALRDFYHTFTREEHDVYQMYQDLYKGRNYQEMEKTAKFLLHALGTDLNSGGPSIERAMLNRLMTEVRNLQTLLGVPRNFEQQKGLLNTMLRDNNMSQPPKLNTDTLAEEFFRLAGDHLPTASKAIDIARRLGGAPDGPNSEHALILYAIILKLVQNAIYQVNPNKIFTSPQRKEACWNAVTQALDNIQDDLDNLHDANEQKAAWTTDSDKTKKPGPPNPPRAAWSTSTEPPKAPPAA